MALVVIAVWLVALAGCAWLGFASIKLMIHGFQRAFAPTFGPPATPKVDGSKIPDATAAGAARADLAPWVLATITDHLCGCVTCRSAVESYRHEQGNPATPLASLQPVTLARMLAVIETEDVVVVAP
jgi:hypothetical protein